MKKRILIFSIGLICCLGFSLSCEKEKEVAEKNELLVGRWKTSKILVNGKANWHNNFVESLHHIYEFNNEGGGTLFILDKLTDFKWNLNKKEDILNISLKKEQISYKVVKISRNNLWLEISYDGEKSIIHQCKKI